MRYTLLTVGTLPSHCNTLQHSYCDRDPLYSEEHAFYSEERTLDAVVCGTLWNQGRENLDVAGITLCNSQNNCEFSKEA